MGSISFDWLFAQHQESLEPFTQQVISLFLGEEEEVKLECVLSLVRPVDCYQQQFNASVVHLYR